MSTRHRRPERKRRLLLPACVRWRGRSFSKRCDDLVRSDEDLLPDQEELVAESSEFDAPWSRTGNAFFLSRVVWARRGGSRRGGVRSALGCRRKCGCDQDLPWNQVIARDLATELHSQLDHGEIHSADVDPARRRLRRVGRRIVDSTALDLSWSSDSRQFIQTTEGVTPFSSHPFSSQQLVLRSAKAEASGDAVDGGFGHR